MLISGNKVNYGFFQSITGLETGWKPGKWPYVAFGENAFF